MPKNNVTDPITDQEIAFARLVLSGTMTDRHAAEAAGLDPSSAAYIKAKPGVRAYMQQRQAAVQQQLVEQENGQSRPHQISRDQILARLWEIANLSPAMTRGSITGQVKALSMILAIEGLVPDRGANPGALSGQKTPAPPSAAPEIYVSAWRREQQAEIEDPEPYPAPQQGVPEPQPAPGHAEGPPPGRDPLPALGSSKSIFADGFRPLANGVRFSTGYQKSPPR